MNRALTLCAVVVVALMIATPGLAQMPKVSVYFDAAYTQTEMDCPGPSLDTLYVVAENFGTFINGLEFKIQYPPQMIWLADLPAVVNPYAFAIGNSPTGASLGWALPQNGFIPLCAMRVLILWNCVDCSSANGLVQVMKHPATNFLGAAEFGTGVLIDAEGSTAVVCPRPMKMDIKPGSCPNAFNKKLFDFARGENPKKGGVLPVAILGEAGFDVSLIDPSSIRLEGVEPLSQGGGPKIQDVSTPVADNSDCECTTDGPDGFDDLNMKFSAQEVAAAIGPGDGDRELTMTFDYNGVPYSATDCIHVIGKEFKPNVPMPEGISVSIFPNPFNPMARVKFALPETQPVRLAIYTVTGELVEVLHKGVKEAGEHVMEWDASGHPSGVYFVRLEGSNASVVKRIVFLK